VQLQLTYANINQSNYEQFVQQFEVEVRKRNETPTADFDDNDDQLLAIPDLNLPSGIECSDRKQFHVVFPKQSSSGCLLRCKVITLMPIFRARNCSSGQSDLLQLFARHQLSRGERNESVLIENFPTFTVWDR
jgi:hypothetical protein